MDVLQYHAFDHTHSYSNNTLGEIENMDFNVSKERKFGGQIYCMRIAEFGNRRINIYSMNYSTGPQSK